MVSLVGVYLTLNGKYPECQVTFVPESQAWLGLEQFGGQAGHFAALAGRERHVPEALLAPEGSNEDRKRVVRLAHVGGVDLAGVAGEDHLGALADAREDRLQRRRLEVLRLIDDDELLLQRPTA